MWALILVGLFHSIMFPTIFTLGIGAGPLDRGSLGLLIMAIAGGALVVVQGKLADAFGLQTSFLTAAACELYIIFYALGARRRKKSRFADLEASPPRWLSGFFVVSSKAAAKASLTPAWRQPSMRYLRGRADQHAHRLAAASPSPRQSPRRA
jgi:hypothetical protein